MQEFYSLLELLGMLATDPRTGVLIALLIVAAISDYRSFRIPNWLTLGGIVFALFYKTMVTPSSFRELTGAIGGMLIGFGVMLPLYAFKTMGAGDVKLVAMVGAFLGASNVLYAILYTFIAGGIAALGFAFFNQAWMRMFGNVKNVLHTMMVSATFRVKPEARMEAGQSVGRLPYGVSICV
ncbi:MAG: Type prepilin peptidase TadV/CpaA, partial [Variovorax sp.]|nr:Type prepilin peptidase TadV/CpaA [Variovorax sp.]